MPLGDIRSVVMPYCIRKQEDGRYAVLNREYKPVGFRTGEWVRYDQHPVLLEIKGLTPDIARQLSWEGKEDTDDIFLYNDGCVPTDNDKAMQAYLARLAILMRLQLA